MHNTDSTKKQSVKKPNKPVNLSVLITGFIGLKGTAILSRHFKDKIDAYYPAYLSREASEYEASEIKNQERARLLLENFLMQKGTSEEESFCTRIGEGGILAALWEFAGKIETGFELDMRKLPIKQETVEICELLEINPYHLMSQEAYIYVLKDAKEAVRMLEKEGINATVVGYTNATKAHVLVNGDIISHINRPEPDELERIGLL